MCLFDVLCLLVAKCHKSLAVLFLTFRCCLLVYLDEEDLKVEDVEQELLEGKEEVENALQPEEMLEELSLEDSDVTESESKWFQFVHMTHANCDQGRTQ